MRAGVGTWTEHDFLALKLNLRLGERPPHDVECFQKTGVPLVHRDPKSVELKRAESRTHAHHDSAFAQVIHPTDLFSQPERMVQRQDCDAVANAEAPGPLRDAGRIDRWDAN